MKITDAIQWKTDFPTHFYKNFGLIYWLFAIVQNKICIDRFILHQNHEPSSDRYIIEVFARLKRFQHCSFFYFGPVLCKKTLPENGKAKIWKYVLDLFKVSGGYRKRSFRPRISEFIKSTYDWCVLIVSLSWMFLVEKTAFLFLYSWYY